MSIEIIGIFLISIDVVVNNGIIWTAIYNNLQCIGKHCKLLLFNIKKALTWTYLFIDKNWLHLT